MIEETVLKIPIEGQPYQLFELVAAGKFYLLAHEILQVLRITIRGRESHLVRSSKSGLKCAVGLSEGKCWIRQRMC